MRDRFKAALLRFMTGRHGTDALSLALMVAAILCMLIAALAGSVLLNTVSLALYIVCLFRILSKNRKARERENEMYLKLRNGFKRGAAYGLARLKNTRKYKYFKCPSCGLLLRLPRKTGTVTVTCSRCANRFRAKA